MKPILELPDDQVSQSNGAMMRCSVLALLSLSEYLEGDVCGVDARLTNPSNVVVWTNRTHLYCLRRALLGHPALEIFTDLEYFLSLTIRSQKCPGEVIEIYEELSRKYSKGKIPAVTDRNIASQKGWCLHGLWCSLRILITGYENKPNGFGDCVKDLMVAGADTDTIASIAGGLLGALMGWKKIKKQQKANIQILLECDSSSGPTPRPEKYSPRAYGDFLEMVQKAVDLGKK
jgi:ADP-ribosylglycohydrolase